MGCWFGGSPLHGWHLLLRLQLRFWNKWQSLAPIRHATALQTPVSDHHLTICRPGPLLWGFCAQWDLHNASLHEALPSILERCLLAWLQRWGHHLLRSSLSLRGAWRPTAARKPSTRNRRRLLCLPKMSTASLKYTISLQQIWMFGGHKIPSFTSFLIYT